MRRLGIAVIAFSLTACTTMDPYTGEEKVGNSAKGAGIGAIAGAALGAATASKNDRDKAILTGAALGAAAGGGAGYYMDRQEKVLRDKLAGSGVQVKREGDNLRLIMPVTLPLKLIALRFAVTFMMYWTRFHLFLKNLRIPRSWWRGIQTLLVMIATTKD